MAKKMGDMGRPADRKMKKLWDDFYTAYKALRKEFLATCPGGGMDMFLKVRDEGAQNRFKRRQAGWKKRKANKAASHGQ